MGLWNVAENAAMSPFAAPFTLHCATLCSFCIVEFGRMRQLNSKVKEKGSRTAILFQKHKSSNPVSAAPPPLP